MAGPAETPAKKTPAKKATAKKAVAPKLARAPRGAKARAEVVRERLAGEYPGTAPELCELVHDTPFELLIATILSAQCTDKRVNLVTPELFRRWPGPEALAAAISQAMGDTALMPAIDEAAWQADLQSLGEDQMRNILAIAATILPERLAQLRDALAKDDGAKLAAVAHAAFSAASAAGFVGLQQSLAHIETAAKRGDVTSCGELIETLAGLIDATLAEAESRLGGGTGALNPARAQPRRDSPLRVT